MELTGGMQEIGEKLEPLQLGLMVALVLYGAWIFIYHHIAFLGHHLQEERSIPDPVGGPFFSPQLTNIVEMSFWFVAFVDFYNKMYNEAQDGEMLAKKKSDSPSTFFSPVTSKLIRFSRYLVKYVGTFEKFLKFAFKS